MEDLIRRQPGVLDTRVGYTGGQNDHATYRNHPGHAEAVEIVFDPTQTSYRDILAFFFQIHDPSTLNRQGNDIGTSYRSAIFYTTDEQKRVAEDTIADVDASGLWPGKVVTVRGRIKPPGAATTISASRSHAKRCRRQSQTKAANRKRASTKLKRPNISNPKATPSSTF